VDVAEEPVVPQFDEYVEEVSAVDEEPEYQQSDADIVEEVVDVVEEPVVPQFDEVVEEVSAVDEDQEFPQTDVEVV
jgi:hypothetical protein